jgi:hypothetical protein
MDCKYCGASYEDVDVYKAARIKYTQVKRDGAIQLVHDQIIEDDDVPVYYLCLDCSSEWINDEV